MTIAATRHETPRPGQGTGLPVAARSSRSRSNSAAENEGGKPLEIPLDQIDRNPFQTRSH
jgi:hypothetical protein